MVGMSPMPIAGLDQRLGRLTSNESPRWALASVLSSGRNPSMDKSQVLLLVTAALSLYAVGNVWPVQLSSYPLWSAVGAHEFHHYHSVWWHSIWGVIIAPAVLLFCASVWMLWWRPEGVPGWAVWVGFGLELAPHSAALVTVRTNTPA